MTEVWRGCGAASDRCRPRWRPYVEIAERCQFRLPLRRRRLAAERKEPLGPAQCSSASSRRGVGGQQLMQIFEQSLPALSRVREELQIICGVNIGDPRSGAKLPFNIDEVGCVDVRGRLPTLAAICRKFPTCASAKLRRRHLHPVRLRNRRRGSQGP
jgi:hypothetical protein